MLRNVVHAVFPVVARALEVIRKDPTGPLPDRLAQMSAFERRVADLEQLDQELIPDLNHPNARRQLQGELIQIEEQLSESHHIDPQLKVPVNPTDADPANLAGTRYPVVCWLDEVIFGNGNIRWAASPSPGNGHTLLVPALFGTSIRSYFFWQLAEFAIKKHWWDVVEVFHLAVGLGFQGVRSSAEERRAWLQRAHELTAAGAPLPKPPVLEPPPTPAPLFGRRQLQRLGWVALACAAAWPCLVLALRWVLTPS